MLFSGGMPILYPIGLFSFFLTYWVDKILFVTVYRIPPRYDKGLAVRARRLISIAMIMHFMFAWYMFSNSAIFTYDSDNFSFLANI